MLPKRGSGFWYWNFQIAFPCRLCEWGIFHLFSLLCFCRLWGLVTANILGWVWSPVPSLSLTILGELFVTGPSTRNTSHRVLLQWTGHFVLLVSVPSPSPPLSFPLHLFLPSLIPSLPPFIPLFHYFSFLCLLPSLSAPSSLLFPLLSLSFLYSHLCSLILVEAIDLDWISSNQDAPDQ